MKAGDLKSKLDIAFGNREKDRLMNSELHAITRI